MAELKPCPFCGSDRVEFFPDEEQIIEDTTTGFILCQDCGFSSDRFYSEAHAAEKWNRRPDSNLPAADVAPVRHGRWLAQNDFWRKCSECEGTWHEQWIKGKALNYCPNCGAKMDLKAEIS